MSTKNSKAGKKNVPSEEGSICVAEQVLPNQRIQQRSQEIPGVDKQKIEEIKNQLNNYEFNVDPHRIAQKIIKLENELFGINDASLKKDPLKPSESS